jgi:GTPase involved in cell partitioning and DNA repair
VQQFVDMNVDGNDVMIHVAAGDGGHGCSSVHREKFMPLLTVASGLSITATALPEIMAHLTAVATAMSSARRGTYTGTSGKTD